MPQLCRIQATSCVWWERKTLQHYSPKTAIQQAINCCPHLCCVGHSSCAKTVDKLAPTYYFSAGEKKKKKSFLVSLNTFILNEVWCLWIHCSEWRHAGELEVLVDFRHFFSPSSTPFPVFSEGQELQNACCQASTCAAFEIGAHFAIFHPSWMTAGPPGLVLQIVEWLPAADGVWCWLLGMILRLISLCALLLSLVWRHLWSFSGRKHIPQLSAVLQGLTEQHWRIQPGALQWRAWVRWWEFAF